MSRNRGFILFTVFLLFSFCLFLNNSTLAQSPKDSLITKISTNHGKDKLKALYQLSDLLSKTNLPESSKYAAQTILLALELNDTNYLIKGLNRLGRNYQLQSDYISSERLYKQSLKWALNINDKQQVSYINGYIGHSYLSRGKPKQASVYYYESLKIAEAIQSDTCLALAYNCIGILYMRNKELNSALSYFKKALFISQKLNDKDRQKAFLANVGGILNIQGKTEEAKKYYLKAYTLDSLDHDTMSMINSLYNLGGIVDETGNFAEAKKLTIQAMNLAYQKHVLEVYINCKSTLSAIALRLKNYNEALLYANEALELSVKNNYKKDLPHMYWTLKEIHQGKGNLKQELHYYTLYINLEDSLTKEKNTNYIESLKQQQELENKANQLFFKQNELNLKEKLNRSQKITITILILLIITVAILIMFIGQKNRNKQTLLLQKESLLSFINGQEEERQRISADMHDGICQQLAIIKMNLDALAENSEKNAPVLKSSQEIEKVIDEVREISHHMMPATLSDLGLTEALKSLVFKLNETTQLTIDLLIDESVSGFEKNIEIHLYRIVQELLSNTIKHANASSVKLELDTSLNALQLFYEDNGIGMNSVKKPTGIGLKNIQLRVDILNGQIQQDINKNKLKITVPL